MSTDYTSLDVVELQAALADGATSVDVTRAYVNVLGKFSGGLATRVTSDIYRNADGSLGLRLKYAYFGYTPHGSPLTLKLKSQ